MKVWSHKMKTVLVAVNATYNHTNLAIKYLKRFYLKSGYSQDDMEIICREFTINDDFKENAALLLKENANVFGFSCYIWNVRIILEMVEILKKINPGCLIVLGGPEISFEDDAFFDAHPQVDYIIRGQGELAFAKLLNHIANNNNEMTQDLNFYDSKKSKYLGRIIDEEPVPLDKIAFPYDERDFAVKQKQYYYETTRGCPYCCSYCLSSAADHIICLPADRVKREMNIFIDMKVKQVKLVDRTFNFNDQRAMEIWKFLIERYRQTPYKTNFHFEITADLLSEESIDLLRTAPKEIFQFEIGIQSTDPTVLENVRRKSNLCDVFTNIKKIQEADNISIHLDLIAGLPGENWATFTKSFNDVYNLRPSMLQLGFLKVLKGSAIRKESRDLKIIFSDNPPYEVLSTESMSFFELLRLKKIEDMVDRYYNSEQFKYSLEFLCKYTDDVFGMFGLLEQLWEEKGLFRRKVARQEMIQIFLNFGTKMIEQANNEKIPQNVIQQKSGKYGLTDKQIDMFRDLLKFDYYRFDKKTIIECLGINHSNHHPDLSREKERKEWYLSNGKPAAVKPRLERFSFDAAKLTGTKQFIAAQSFVLYEMNGDKPKIIDILTVS